MKRTYNETMGEFKYFPDDEGETLPAAKSAKPKSLSVPMTKPKTAGLEQREGPLSSAEKQRRYRLRHGDTYRASHAAYMRKIRTKAGEA